MLDQQETQTDAASTEIAPEVVAKILENGFGYRAESSRRRAAYYLRNAFLFEWSNPNLQYELRNLMRTDQFERAKAALVLGKRKLDLQQNWLLMLSQRSYQDPTTKHIFLARRRMNNVSVFFHVGDRDQFQSQTIDRLNLLAKPFTGFKYRFYSYDIGNWNIRQSLAFSQRPVGSLAENNKSIHHFVFVKIGENCEELIEFCANIEHPLNNFFEIIQNFEWDKFLWRIERSAFDAIESRLRIILKQKYGNPFSQNGTDLERLRLNRVRKCPSEIAFSLLVDQLI